MPKITLKGNPVEVTGSEVQVGQPAPDFRLQASDMSDVTLATHEGKTRIIAAVPSLDTPVCDIEMKRFNDEAAKLDNAVVICASTDLPFAMGRWCGANAADAVLAASDHRDTSFGQAYGCLIASGPLERCLVRAVFVIGPDNSLRHVEYVPEIAEQPNYDAIIAAARQG